MIRKRETSIYGCLSLFLFIILSADRIIVGEVRDKSAADMLAAFDTGHDGSLSTGHANSTKDMLTRLESMVLQAMDVPLEAIRQQIAAAVDIMVHLERLPDRSRKVVEIEEISGYENGSITLNPLFIYDQRMGKLMKTGTLIHRKKLIRAGLSDE